MTTHQDTSTEHDLVSNMRALEADHEPDGWPAVRMSTISHLCDVIERLRAALYSRDEAAQQPQGQAVSDEQIDAERYRWLRAQHEGHEPLSYDADGFPMPLEPTALAFTVFRPDRGSLEPVGCIPGELDAAIDAAQAAQQKGGA